MALPRGDEYNLAVQHPETCFSDAELRKCRVECTALGLPRPYSGGFTTTYRLFDGSRQWAVRCFTREVQELRIRYAAISDFLSKHKGEPFVPAEYLEKGILVNGRWYPVIKMEWIEGQLLNEYIESRLNNRKALADLAGKFRQMVEKLEQLGVAHGDLQHGNILVSRNRLYLIDYDGMYVPALAGLASGEVGHPNYQHPARDEHTFGPAMDRFSSILIYLGLIAVGRYHWLWALYNDQENILFRKTDLVNSSSSALLQELLALPGMAAPIKELLKLIDRPPEQLPALDDFLKKLDFSPAALAQATLPDWLKDHVSATEKEEPVLEEPTGTPGLSAEDKPLADAATENDPFGSLTDERVRLVLSLLAGVLCFFLPEPAWPFSVLAPALYILWLYLRYRKMPVVEGMKTLETNLSSCNQAKNALEQKMESEEEKIKRIRSEVSRLRSRLNSLPARFSQEEAKLAATTKKELAGYLTPYHYTTLAQHLGKPASFVQNELDWIPIAKYYRYSSLLLNTPVLRFTDFTEVDAIGQLRLSGGRMLKVEGIGAARGAELMSAKREAVLDILAKAIQPIPIQELFSLCLRHEAHKLPILQLQREYERQHQLLLREKDLQSRQLGSEIQLKTRQTTSYRQKISPLKAQVQQSRMKEEQLRNQLETLRKQLRFGRYLSRVIGN